MKKMGGRSKDILLRGSAVMPSLTRSDNLVVDRGDGSTNFDVDGNGYLEVKWHRK